MKLHDPAGSGQALNVSINNAISPPSRGIYVGGSGHVNVTLAEDGTLLLLTSLAAGVIHPFKVKNVWAAGTTATNVVIVR